MTTPRRDGMGTPFGDWIRHQKAIDSKLGFRATNIDYVWKHERYKPYMLIEEKRFCAHVKPWQQRLFDLIDAQHRADPDYVGFYVLRFEHNTPDDGRVWLCPNNRPLDACEITADELIEVLASIAK